MKRPTFSFEAEVLTDAPYAMIVGRLCEDGPQSFQCLRVLSHWEAPERCGGNLLLRWSRRVAGAEESGALTLSSDPKGAHLHLTGRMKGWSGFLLFGLLRWRTDRLLDRLVEEL